MFVPHTIHKHGAGLKLSLLRRDRRSARGRPDRTRARFRLEGLEDRCLLSITEFPIPTGGSQPLEIAAGSDGNLWFTEGAASKIGKINPTTDAISEFATPTAGALPALIATGPDGNLWFTEDNAGQIGEINPTTDAINEYSIPYAGTRPIYIAAGPDGDLWFSDAGTNAIETINPTSHAFSEFTIPTGNSNPQGITEGPDGNLWFVEQAGNKIGMLNPTTGTITEFSIPTANANPIGIAAGSNGNVWFAERAGNNIGEINLTSHAITEFATPTGGSGPYEMTAGPDGNVWFTEGNVGQIGLINPTTDAINEYPVPYGNSGPNGISSGPDGNVWFDDQPNNAIGVVSLNSARHFVVTGQPPSSVIAGSIFGLTIEAEDSSGDLDSSFNGTVTVALAKNPGGATLGGTLTATASGGIATFSGLTLNKAASGYTLTVSASGVDGAATSAITVTPAPASQLVIHTQPSATATAGQAFGAQPVIEEEDQYGNVETSDNSTVITATLESGTGPLQGTITATVSGGVATFTNLAENTAGTISLAFSGDGLTDATSSSIVISPAAPSQLVIETEPSSTATAGHAFATEPVVYEEDQFGNLETGDNSKQVSVTLGSGTGPLQGTTRVTLSGGVATFTNLVDKKAETISLEFSSGSLANVTYASIVVSPAATSELVIQTQPSATATAGQAFAIQPVIYEEDQYGNLETGDNSTVVTVAPFVNGGPLQGPTAVTVSGGVAAFAGLADDLAESITLRFTEGGVHSFITNSIIVSPAPASQWVITQEPSATATAGQAFATQPVIAEEDPFGNIETGDSHSTITASLASGSGPLLGTTTIAVRGGVATFKNLADDGAEVVTLSFSGLGQTTAAPSSSIAVSPAKASQLVIHTQPSATATAGQAFAIQPVVYEEDQFGNLEIGDASTVITATLTSGAGVLQGTIATVAGGVATFTNLADQKAGAVTLTFTGGGLTSVPSSSVTVSAAAASKVVFGQQPMSAAPGAAIAPAVTVKVEDAFDNVVSNDGSTVTLTLSGGALEGGSSTVAATTSSGVATFSNLKIDLPGSYTLSATDESADTHGCEQ